MQHLEFPEMGPLDPTSDTRISTMATIPAAALSPKMGPGGLPTSGPLAGTLSKDTLAGGILHIIPGGRGGVHLLRVGELGHQLHLEIFSPLILLPSVDEHFVLQRNDTCQGSQGPGLEDVAHAKPGGL